MRDVDEVRRQARLSAECTHNHPEGLKGAECIAHCIAVALQARQEQGDGMLVVRRIAEQYGYDVSLSSDAIRRTNTFNETCQVTVPQAIICFLESTGFEDAVRLAVSIGGDSDTIAAITGSIAEAYYGIPEHIEGRAMSYLTDEMKQVINQFKHNHE